MTTRQISPPEYIADALHLVHGDEAYAEARRQHALNLRSGDTRNAELWQRVARAVDTPRAEYRSR
jgi:hypothetical protein